MIVLAYLGSQCTKFHSWMNVLIFYDLLFGVVSVAWCYFPMNPTKEQHQILCKSRKKCEWGPGNYYTSVRGRKHEQQMGVCMACPNSPRPKKARQVKNKVKSNNKLNKRNSVLLEKLTVSHLDKKSPPSKECQRVTDHFNNTLHSHLRSSHKWTHWTDSVTSFISK
jgi:hypothetical protein